MKTFKVLDQCGCMEEDMYINVVCEEEDIQDLGPGWLYRRKRVYSINCSKSLKKNTLKVWDQGGCMEEDTYVSLILVKV